MSPTTSEITPRVSAFIRALLRFHGDKVIFANISSAKGMTDPTLVSLLSQHHSFSRFAPTPSNSLHIGSIRTALISYLFSMTNATRGRFHIRFDDTNVKKTVAEQNISHILKDLSWIGFPRSITQRETYRQSSPEAARNYDLALALFNSANLVVERDDGGLELRPPRGLVTSSYWLDLRRGPRVLHEPPRLSSNRNPLDYSLCWPPDTAGGNTLVGVLRGHRTADFSNIPFSEAERERLQSVQFLLEGVISKFNQPTYADRI